MRVTATALSGIRDFKFVGPKPSQTRKANQRKRLQLIQSNHAVLSLLDKSLRKTKTTSPGGRVDDARTATSRV